jgi:alkylhydroperoxidase family enzyme
VTRIPVPGPGELRADAEQLVAAIAPPGREPAQTMAVLARQPDLLAPFLGWAAALALNGVLPKRDHEILALRVASNCNSGFEWVEHVEYARNAGLSDIEIEAIPEAIENGRWTEAEQALLRAADELHESDDVTDATWTVLAQHYEPPQLVEILFVVGQYTMLSMVANAAGLDEQSVVTSQASYGSSNSIVQITSREPATRLRGRRARRRGDACVVREGHREAGIVTAPIADLRLAFRARDRITNRRRIDHRQNRLPH